MGSVLERLGQREAAARVRVEELRAEMDAACPPARPPAAAGLGVSDADGISHRKMEVGHARHLATVFGTVRVARCAWRAPGARNLYPADAALNLPEHRHSHTLAKRAAIKAARDSFDSAHAAITRACGKVVGKRQVEQLTIQAAGEHRRLLPLPGATAVQRRHAAVLERGRQGSGDVRR